MTLTVLKITLGEKKNIEMYIYSAFSSSSHCHSLCILREHAKLKHDQYIA